MKLLAQIISGLNPRYSKVRNQAKPEEYHVFDSWSRGYVPLKEALDSTAAGRYVELLNGQQSSGNAYLANALVTAINNGQVQEVGNVLAATQAKAKPAPSASAPATPVKKQSPVMPSV